MHYPSLQHEELIHICIRTGETAAWEEFIRRFNPVIARVALRTAKRWSSVPAALLDDLVQETYLKLYADGCRVLRTFEFRQPDAIFGYLKVVTANVVHDHMKAVHAARRRSDGETEQSELDPNAANESARLHARPSSQEQMERAVLLQEIDQHLQKCVAARDFPRSRLVFWLYYRTGLTAKAIASLPGVGLTTEGVESALMRMTRSVKASLANAKHATQRQKGPPGRKGFSQAESF